MIDPVEQDTKEYHDKLAKSNHAVKAMDIDAFMEGRDLYDIVDPLELGKEVLRMAKYWHRDPEYFGGRVLYEIMPFVYEAMKEEL